MTPTARQHLTTLAPFLGRSQRLCIQGLLRGEEAAHFEERLAALAATVTAMPRTYDNEKTGAAPMAALHFFTPGCDAYAVELDIDTDGEGQIQVFGMVNLGYGPELGYFSIPEWLAMGAELDLHFTPRPLAGFLPQKGAAQ